MKASKLGAPKMVFGVGINDADYVVQKMETIGYVNGKRKQKLVWVCPYYRVWTKMLERCYSEVWYKKYPTYRGCSVSEEWLRFSNFRSWMERKDFEGMQLDKDLLFEGNKVYSEETCVFVSGMVNKFTTDRSNDRGEWLIGVYWKKENNKFAAQVNNPFTKKYEYLGYFTCELKAHQAWLTRKLELAHELAAVQTDTRVAEALIERYTGYLKSGSYLTKGEN